MHETAELILEECATSTRTVTFQGSAYTWIKSGQASGQTSCSATQISGIRK